jgi:hypothetical protein
MNVRPTKILSGALALGAGAGLMYLLDPDHGRRRRALVKDKLRHGATVAGTKASATANDLGNRARGLGVEAMKRVRKEELTDEQLAQRVRAKLGHHTSHSSAIEVSAHDGRVILSGPVLTAEAEDLVKAIHKVRGVDVVENRLQFQDTWNGLPGSQPAPLEH